MTKEGILNFRYDPGAMAYFEWWSPGGLLYS